MAGSDAATERLFFDGDCGLCHSSVRWVIARDRERHFRYAPLAGPTFEPHRARLEQSGAPANIPDSSVVVTSDGELLTRTDGVAYVLRQLSPTWRLLGRLLAAVPRPARDFVYDCVAKTRHHFFRRPREICPIASGEQRALFDP